MYYLAGVIFVPTGFVVSFVVPFSETPASEVSTKWRLVCLGSYTLFHHVPRVPGSRSTRWHGVVLGLTPLRESSDNALRSKHICKVRPGRTNATEHSVTVGVCRNTLPLFTLPAIVRLVENEVMGRGRSHSRGQQRREQTLKSHWQGK